MKTREVITFRPDKRADVQKRLELADKLGINISEVMREALPTLLDKKIKQRTAEMRELLETVPA